MKSTKTQLTSVFIFAGLAAMVLIGFQNCSPSLVVLGFGKPAKASDLSDMLQASRSEVDSTAQQFKSKSRKINSIPQENLISVYGEVKDPEEIKKQLALKLEKKSKK